MAKVVQVKGFPVIKGFLAINLCGVIFTKEPLTAVELNHELIHTAQQRELLYLGFYLWYVVEWAVLTLKYRSYMKGYYHIRFEKEAYNHQYDLGYMARRRHFHYS